MDERAASPDLPPPHLDAAPAACCADLKYLALLLLLTVGLRTWQLTHTEVTARDSIGYIRIAWNLEHGDWADVIRKSPQHPGFPVAVRVVSVPVRFFVPDLARAMQLSAQLTSALASVLLVVPLYFLGRELFARNIAFWGVLLFQCLPSPGRIMADGLSEPLFLFFAATSLALAVTSLRKQWVLGFALAGLASGAAYLTRPEGAIIAAATGLILVFQQLGSRWRRPWPVTLKCGVGLSLGVLLLAAPFMRLIGGLTLKYAANQIIKNVGAEADGAPWLRQSRLDAQPVVTGPLLAMWWDKFSAIYTPGGVEARRGWGLHALALCLAKGLFFVGVAPALLALWVFRDRYRLHPGASMLTLFAAILLVLLYRVAVVGGYLSDRHVILLTMLGCFWAAAGTVVIGRWLAARLHRPAAVTAWTTGLLALLCIGSAVKSLETLHSERAGFRQAGYWLAKNAPPDAKLIDPYTWTSYYAGRMFQESAGEPNAASKPAVCYVILDVANKHTHLDVVDEARKLAETGREIHRWNLKRGEVAIFEVDENVH